VGIVALAWLRHVFERRHSLGYEELAGLRDLDLGGWYYVRRGRCGQGHTTNGVEQ